MLQQSKVGNVLAAPTSRRYGHCFMSSSELQFDKAEFTEPPSEVQDGPLMCTGCSREIDGSFWEINGAAVCEPCFHRITAPPPGTRASRFLAALGWGSGASVLGCLLYYAIYRLTGYELGLVAVVVGVGVGMGVRRGARGIGGVWYQLLAIGLTYLSITTSYFLALLHESTIQGYELDALGRVIVFGWSLAMPFLNGFSGLLGILIIGFGLYEAWKFNRRPPKLQIDGPFVLEDEEPAPHAP